MAQMKGRLGRLVRSNIVSLLVKSLNAITLVLHTVLVAAIPDALADFGADPTDGDGKNTRPIQMGCFITFHRIDGLKVHILLFRGRLGNFVICSSAAGKSR